MLLITFQHIRGIGKKKEAALWREGAISWDAYVSMHNAQLSLFGDLASDSIRLSQAAYKKGDMGFFAESLPNSQYYRIALTYPEGLPSPESPVNGAYR